VVWIEDTTLKLGIERMAQAIRSGQIDGQRLQEYHRARYGYDRLASRWLEALLHPQDFWKNGLGLQQEPRTRSAANAQEPSSASVLRQGA